MPKWEKFLEEEEVIPSFEKFDKTLKNGRKLLKKSNDETVEEKKQRERARDEERVAKRGDEV